MDNLPDYTVRVSTRAKRARLVMSLNEGLVVVVPRRFDQRRIPSLLESKRTWLAKAFARVEADRRLLEPAPENGLPEAIFLRAIGEEWTVIYRETASGRVALREGSPDCLTVTGDVSNVDACKACIRRWLSRKAQGRLVPWLEQLARQTGLPFERTSIKMQRTRWGSCSRQGTVSLNLKLLFLPAPLAQYVLVHELCHRAHLDHSAAFWALVRKYEPDFKARESLLKTGFRYVPTWLDR